MTSLLQDLLYALRQTRYTPGFAQRGDILTLALRGASILLLAGIAVGIGVGLFTAHMVDNFLYDTGALSSYRCIYPLPEHSRHSHLHAMQPLSTCKNFVPDSWETE